MTGACGIGVLAVIAAFVLYLIVGWIAGRNYQRRNDE